MSEKILKLYTDPKNPGSFSGLSGFLKNNKKVKEKEALKTLRVEETYSLQTPVRKKFVRSKFLSTSIDETWQLDLFDVSSLKNKQFKQFYSYLLVCIDVFSKFAWVEPMQTKHADSCINAFKKILERAYPRKLKCVYMDKGREFMGNFYSFCKKMNIFQILTNSVHKASVLNGLIELLKEKMYRYFTYANEKNYIQVLQDLLESYNNSYNRSIKTEPINVTKKNENDIFLQNFLETDNSNIKFKIGEYVKVSIKKKLFEKG